MTRYTILPARQTRADWEEPGPAPALPHPQVFVPEPVKTGLLDQNGNPIYRLPEPIGFLPDDLVSIGRLR